MTAAVPLATGTALGTGVTGVTGVTGASVGVGVAVPAEHCAVAVQATAARRARNGAKAAAKPADPVAHWARCTNTGGCTTPNTVKVKGICGLVPDPPVSQAKREKDTVAVDGLWTQMRRHGLTPAVTQAGLHVALAEVVWLKNQASAAACRADPSIVTETSTSVTASIVPLVTRADCAWMVAGTPRMDAAAHTLNPGAYVWPDGKVVAVLHKTTTGAVNIKSGNGVTTPAGDDQALTNPANSVSGNAAGAPDKKASPPVTGPAKGHPPAAEVAPVNGMVACSVTTSTVPLVVCISKAMLVLTNPTTPNGWRQLPNSEIKSP